MLKNLLCRILGHKKFVCYYCNLAMLGVVRGISVRPCENPDRHDTCGRCGEDLQ
jgi:hypothetical protein